VPPDSAQATVWAALSRAYAGNVRGFAFYHYPILRGQGRRPRQPDIALFDPGLGLCVIECRGYRAGDVRAVEGEDWHLADREDPPRGGAGPAPGGGAPLRGVAPHARRGGAARGPGAAVHLAPGVAPARARPGRGVPRPPHVRRPAPPEAEPTPDVCLVCLGC